MPLRHSIELELKDSTPKAELVAFLGSVEDGAVISTIVRTTPKDRPWESERTTVTLQARWSSE